MRGGCHAADCGRAQRALRRLSSISATHWLDHREGTHSRDSGGREGHRSVSSRRLCSSQLCGALLAALVLRTAAARVRCEVCVTSASPLQRPHTELLQPRRRRPRRVRLQRRQRTAATGKGEPSARTGGSAGEWPVIRLSDDEWAVDGEGCACGGGGAVAVKVRRCTADSFAIVAPPACSFDCVAPRCGPSCASSRASLCEGRGGSPHSWRVGKMRGRRDLRALSRVLRVARQAIGWSQCRQRTARKAQRGTT